MSTWRGQMREAHVVRVALMNEGKDKPITFVAWRRRRCSRHRARALTAERAATNILASIAD
jgi:hypothetical protein